MNPVDGPTATFWSYAIRGRNDGWRYVVTPLLAVLLAIAVTAALTVAFVVAGQAPADFAKRAQNPAADPVTFFLFNGLVFAMFVAAFAAVIPLIHRKRFTDILGAWRWGWVGGGFLVWAVVLAAGAGVDYALQPSSFHWSANRQTGALTLAALVGLSIQTFAEEFVFRGYVTQGLLLATKRTVPAAVISGLLFGALHIPNGWPQAANAVFFGIILALIAMRVGGIAFTYGIHLANNLFGAVVLVSSGDAFKGSPGLFTQNTPQLMWWDALVGAVALAAVAVLVYRRAWNSGGVGSL
jgi:membrane protease YdiL (CAAX protease family)